MQNRWKSFWLISLGFLICTSILPQAAWAETQTKDVQHSDRLLKSIEQPWGIAFLPNGELVISSSSQHQLVKGTNGNWSVLTGLKSKNSTLHGYQDGLSADAKFNMPTYLAVDSKGTVYISDTNNHVIRKMKNGKVYTFAGNGTAGYKDGKGGVAQFNAPAGIAIDKQDYVYVADGLNHVIRKISPTGDVTTFAGQYILQGDYRDGAAATARFNEPEGLAFNDKGGLFIADSGNQMIRLVQDGQVTTFAGALSALNASTGYRVGGHQDGARLQAQFYRPRGLAFADGTLFIADSLNHQIRAIRSDGQVVTMAGSNESGDQQGTAEQIVFNQPTGLVVQGGYVYVSDMLNGQIKRLELEKQSL